MLTPPPLSRRPLSHQCPGRPASSTRHARRPLGEKMPLLSISARFPSRQLGHHRAAASRFSPVEYRRPRKLSGLSACRPLPRAGARRLLIGRGLPHWSVSARGEISIRRWTPRGLGHFGAISAGLVAGRRVAHRRSRRRRAAKTKCHRPLSPSSGGKYRRRRFGEVLSDYARLCISLDAALLCARFSRHIGDAATDAGALGDTPGKPLFLFSAGCVASGHRAADVKAGGRIPASRCR